ncbi:AAA family ATPase [Streptomyces kaniharaensis]|uniref:AAA family ATPase n=1 Tax=Streptomyces kaniharaensis TaxID=212423 RepID=A0A6N7KVY3_9ACTN|nr:AAA family ATPase [Streptomyces kaniharaensis]MQS15802.1 AAA family ATPase [Streptomyces kaniharaensis]
MPGGPVGTGGPDRPALREREPEIASAAEAVRAVCRRVEERGDIALGELLLYVGPAGLGKTSLLTEARRLAKHAGCTVLFARGGEQRRNEPFHVVRQLLQPALAELSASERDEVFGSWFDIVGPAAGLLPPAGRLDPQGVRDGLDFVLIQLLRRRAPLAVMVDDLHWADPESLGWLAGFTVRSRELPVLLVFACRDEFPDGVAEFRQTIVGRADRLHELRPLQPASVADLVRAALGDAAEDAFCRHVWAVTGGNPYETAELLREVRNQRLDPVETNAGQLRELAADAMGMTLGHWVEKLGPGTLRFAWAASLLGTGIRQDLAGAICAQGPDAAADSVRELRRHRVLTSTADGRLEFVHPLIASSIYQSMPPATRTGMHGMAATEVENAGLGLLAASRHLLETHPEGDDEIVRKLRLAAAEHLAIGAPEAAVRCLRRAMSEPPDDEDRAAVLYELGCSALLTDPAATVNQLRLALDEKYGLTPELRVDATFRLAQALAHSNRLGEAAAVCADEAARTAAGPGRRRLEVAQFMFETFQAEEPDGPDRSRRLAEYSRHLPGDDGLTAAVSVLRCWDLVLRGADVTGAMALAESVTDDGRLPASLGWTDTTWGFELPGILGISYLYADRVDRAEALFGEAVLAYQVAGWSGAHLGFALFLMGLLRFRSGALDEAETFLRRALLTAERIAPGIPLQWFAVGVLADTLLARGRPDEAWELARTYDFGPPYPTVMVLPDAPTLYGRLLLAGGDLAGAAEALTAAGAALDARGWRNPVWAPWIGHLALAVAPKDPDRARELAAEAVRRAREFGPGTAVGSTLRLCAAVHDGPSALAMLEEAVHRLADAPNRYEHALALADLGSAVAAAGRPAEARRHLDQALGLAVRCGAHGLADRARAELAGLPAGRL